MSDQYNAAQPYGGAPSQQKGPDNPSSDYQAMLPYWQMVEAINGGAETIRRAGELYLHRMTNESADDYRIRRIRAVHQHLSRCKPQSCVKCSICSKQQRHKPSCRFHSCCLISDGKLRRVPFRACARFKSGTWRPSLLRLSRSPAALFIQSRQDPFRLPDGADPKNSLAGFVSPQRVQVLTIIRAAPFSSFSLLWFGLFELGRNLGKIEP
jgi:hypothetical protein